MLPYCMSFLIEDHNLLPPTQKNLEALTTILDFRQPHAQDILDKVTVAIASPITGMKDEWFDKLPSLKLIAIMGVGLDQVNLKEARRRGIDVTSAHGVPTDDVANMAIALLLSLARNTPMADRLIRAGKWPQDIVPPLGIGLKNKRFGQAGLGAIGRAIAHKAEGLGMQMQFYEKFAVEAPAHWKKFDSILELAQNSDILTLAISATPETQKIINKEILQALGKNGVLINIARGAVIDEEALIEALKTGMIKGAGLDVFWNEPNINPAFFELDNIVLSPHQGSSTVETRLNCGQCAVDNIAAVLACRAALTLVN
ncbi:MAG: 2-hydroxyacid dehydrogenase [Candidatus Tokpelaia sp.]|uniref:NAD(P)-dependent oxidoreductase n=1 Tax=Candidatus Tokpelaia sp. TaxID=2233777 RepID=UPI001238490E|nr:NAD(P)-dependent oxidoreductase [Candidatus Tokpelaia sp.]KAA6207058.1 MAG: 2-hydroxyacid dehydrogenase [Candidatus Tokpelaia sp.]